MRNARLITVYALLFMVCLVIAPASGLAEEKISSTMKYSGYTSPEYSSYARSAEYVTASDGTKLAATMYLPSDGPSQGPFPVIFIFTPYHRENIDMATGELKMLGMMQGIVGSFTPYGYAVVTADMRGCGASYGAKISDLSPHVAGDGKDIVDWIAAQPWCDGNVGMMGGSYYGFSVHATASKKPDALKCIIPSIAHFDAFSSAYFYPGGIFNQGFINGFGGRMVLRDKNAYQPPYLPTAPVVDEDGDDELVDEIPLDLDGDGFFVNDYQLPDNPPQYSDGNEREHIYYLATLEHLSNPVYHEWSKDSYFRDAVVGNGGHNYTFRDLGPAYFPDSIAESGIPMHTLTGWFDCFVRGTAQWYSTLRQTNPSKMIIGPTNHITPGFSFGRNFGPYVEYFGEDPEEIATGYNLERLRFLDRHLKGIENGIEQDPSVYLYVMNGEGWRAENEWPLARQVTGRLYFDEGNTISVARRTEGSDDYTADLTHDSRHPVNLKNRYTLGLPAGIHMRTEQDLKCLTYTSTQLKRDMEVTGHPIVRLWVSCSAVSGADFFVYLEDVDENGEACYVTDGLLRANFANLVSREDMLSPGSDTEILPELPWHGFKEADYVDGIFANSNIAELVIDLMPTSWVFKKGHRVRVSIANADWPALRLHPEVSPANDPADPDNIVPTITVHRDADHLSGIELPLIPKGKGGRPGHSKWLMKYFRPF